jgi:hypothetical protein
MAKLSNLPPDDKVIDEPMALDVINRRTLLNFAMLDTQISEMEAQLKEKQAARRVLQDQILRAFENSGVDSIKFLGHSIYTFSQFWAKVKDEGTPRPLLVAALKKHGFKEYVKEDFNVSSVSARIRELDKQYREMHKKSDKEGRKPYQLADYLPKGLVAVMKCEPDYSIRIQGTIPTEELTKLKERMDNDNGNKS